MALVLVDRFHPERRRQEQVEVDAGRLRECDEVELLAAEQLQPLAMFSLVLLIVGGIGFVVLNVAVYLWQKQSFVGSQTAWGILLWVVINIVSYVLILPVHEAIHGLAFIFWGGRPHFGTKLPFALYCGARGQLFRRNHYLIVGLAPLVVITLAGILLTLFAPGAASYVLLATAGNFSGAAGDIWVARRVLKLPRSVLVEDTEVGYKAWEIEKGSSA